MFPYKDKILHEIEEARARKEEENTKRRQEAKERRLGAGKQAEETADGDEPIGSDEDEDLEDYASGAEDAMDQVRSSAWKSDMA